MLVGPLTQVLSLHAGKGCCEFWGRRACRVSGSRETLTKSYLRHGPSFRRARNPFCNLRRTAGRGVVLAG